MVSFENSLRTDWENKENEDAYVFSTTWSYQTSDKPQRAGPQSDIFVVPNLNVMYEEVIEAIWDESTCEPIFEDIVILNIKGPDNKPALSFFSRYHIENFKIPDLEKSINAMDTTIARVKNGEKICCPLPEAGPCLGVPLKPDEEYRQCGTLNELNDDTIAAEKEKETLENALRSWNDSIQQVDDAKIDAKAKDIDIANWFEVSEANLTPPDTTTKLTPDTSPFSKLEAELSKSLKTTVDNHKSKSFLAPYQLIEQSVPLEGSASLIDDADNEKQFIKNSKRIQIAGDAGMFSMTLDTEVMKERYSQICNPDSQIFGWQSEEIKALQEFPEVHQFRAKVPVRTTFTNSDIANEGCNYVLDVKIHQELETETVISAVKATTESGRGK